MFPLTKEKSRKNSVISSRKRKFFHLTDFLQGRTHRGCVYVIYKYKNNNRKIIQNKWGSTLCTRNQYGFIIIDMHGSTSLWGKKYDFYVINTRHETRATRVDEKNYWKIFFMQILVFFRIIRGKRVEKRVGVTTPAMFLMFTEQTFIAITSNIFFNKLKFIERKRDFSLR